MFGSLRVRNYRLYAIGQTVSVGGTWMQSIATGWLALQLSHSGTVLGVVIGARFAPLLLLGPWGGLIVDRVDNRRLIVITQTCLALLSYGLAALAWCGVLTLPVLIAMVTGMGCVNVFDGPSRQSLIPQLVDRRLLPNAIALNSVMMNGAKLVGPAVGGGLISAIGVTPCFLANGTSFAVVVGTLLLMRWSELYPAERATRAKGQIRAGLVYVGRNPALLYPLLMVVVTGILTWEFPVTLPLITTATFHAGAGAYGGAMAIMSVGAVCGGLVAARRRRVSVRSLAVSAVIWGVLIVLASVMPVLPALFGVLIFVGAGSITFNSSAKTLLQMEAAPQMRGRVMSLWSIAWQGGTVIGAPVVGAVGSGLGARYALALSGVAALAVGAVIVALRFRTAEGEGAPLTGAR